MQSIQYTEHKLVHLEKKSAWYFFVVAVILIFLLPLDHAVNKMSVSHANEIWKYNMNLILFQISDFGFS